MFNIFNFALLNESRSCFIEIEFSSVVSKTSSEFGWVPAFLAVCCSRGRHRKAGAGAGAGTLHFWTNLVLVSLKLYFTWPVIKKQERYSFILLLLLLKLNFTWLRPSSVVVKNFFWVWLSICFFHARNLTLLHLFLFSQ